MFKDPMEVTLDLPQLCQWVLIEGIKAVDPDRNLCLYTTRGNAKDGYEKWFVQRIAPNGKIDRTEDPVKFRAYDLNEAINKANTDKRLMARIAKLTPAPVRGKRETGNEGSIGD